MKFWRFKKKWIEAVLAFAMTAVLAGCAWQGTAISEEGGLLTKTQVEEDRKQAIQYVEDVHPFFELEEDQSEYKEAKKAYISQTQSGMTVWEFWGATAEYMSSLRDAHTRIQDPGGIKVLDIPASYENGKSYLWENGKRTGLYVEKVGGVDVEKIYEKIDKMIVAENAAAEEQNREKYLAVNTILKFCGAVSKNDQVEVEFSDGTKRIYSFMEVGRSTEEVTNNCFTEGDIFVVDFNTCEVDQTLEEIAVKLEEAVENGCTKVIIDVRGNMGGDSNACLRILEAMGMREPYYGSVIRFSKEAKEQGGVPIDHGIIETKGSTLMAKANEDVQLIVLSDHITFSSATMLCVWVRDGKLGKIVGEPSTNEPNSYGDILMFQLENSGLVMSVSYKKFTRPDSSNNEDMLVPDVQTSSEDAYDKAVELLNRQ